MRAINIDWDAPEDVIGTLPTEIIIPEGTDEEDIPDYLSDQTGWLHKGYVLDVEEDSAYTAE